MRVSETLLQTIELNWSNQVRYVLRFFCENPVTPHNALILCMLFAELDDSDAVKEIREWLRIFVSSYLFLEPRTQSNQIEKLIGISAFLYATSFLGASIDDVHRRSIGKYFEYACQEDFFDSATVAFVVYLANDIDYASSVNDFFSKRFTLFIERADFQDLAKAFICLNGDDYQSQQAIITNALLDNAFEMSFMEQSWTLMALKEFQHDSDEPIRELAALVSSRLEDDAKEIGRNRMASLILLASFATTPIESPIDLSSANEYLDVLISRNEDGEIVKLSIEPEIFPVSEIQPEKLTVFDFALAQLSLLQFGWSSVIGVIERDKEELLDAVQGQYSHQHLHFVKPWELAVFNFLVVLFTLISGILILLFFFEVELIQMQLDFSSAKWRNDFPWTFSIPLVILLFLQIVAAVRGKSALAQLFELDLLKFVRKRLNDLRVKDESQ